MAGVTFSQPGNWTSWPPHEHAVLAEEAYLYIDMPHPAFGVQLVYADDRNPELATIVREGDVVLMPQGYHPNVAAPGHPINFLWMMAANRELEDRQFGVVNVHPDFAVRRIRARHGTRALTRGGRSTASGSTDAPRSSPAPRAGSARRWPRALAEAGADRSCSTPAASRRAGTRARPSSACGRPDAPASTADLSNRDGGDATRRRAPSAPSARSTSSSTTPASSAARPPPTTATRTGTR